MIRSFVDSSLSYGRAALAAAQTGGDPPVGTRPHVYHPTGTYEPGKVRTAQRHFNIPCADKEVPLEVTLLTSF